MDLVTLILLGPQGSGKGTQADLLKKYLTEHDGGKPIVHFEMGENLRALSTKDNYTGRLTKEILASGSLIPHAVSASVFANYLMEHILTGQEHLIIDGFPRTQEQLSTLDSAVEEFYKRANPKVICINISDEEALARLLKRGRSDDAEESIRKRLQWSREQTMPNIAWFSQNPHYEVIEISGEGSIEETHQAILHKLNLS